MKTCPACRTQYTDETLSFCLQDGTPLCAAHQADMATVVLDDEETMAARTSGRGHPRHTDPISAVSDQSQVTHVATLHRERKGTNTVVAVAATVVLMLLLIGIAGVAGFLYLRNSDRQIGQNTSNGSNVPGGETDNGKLATPQTSTLATPAATLPPATPSTTSTTITTTSTLDNEAQIRGEVSQRVYDWKSTLESRNLSAYMDNYADTVDYYRKQNLNIGAVRADKARAFSLYDSMRQNLSNMNVSVDRTGETATAVFDKEWSFSGRDTSAGKVRSQLVFRKFNGRWLITSERDLKVYYTR
jgi:ketosteroid isomerase-like protein